MAATKENKIVLNTPDKKYSFYNQFEEHLFDICFNPADFDIVKRCDEAINNLNKFQADSINNLSKESDQLEALEQYVKEQTDFIFNKKMADTIFENNNPINLLESGKMFFEEVFEAISKIMEKEFGARVKKLDVNVSKYTAKYQKK